MYFLIFVVVSDYIEDRWSVPRALNGGGPEGATLGILEYLSQSNFNAECVGPEERF